MRIAVDISPIKTGHSVRGIGSYTQKLTDALQQHKNTLDLEFFENPRSSPPADIVHYPYFDLFFHTLPATSKTSRVVTIHDVIPLVFPQYFPAGIRGYINLFFQKRSLKKVDAVICDSNASKSDIVSKLSYPSEKIYVIRLAPGENFRKISDEKSLSTVAKKHNLPKKFVLFVGDVNWNKNINNLLKAVKQLNIRLVMVGKALTDNNLAETKEINKLIRKLKLEKQITKTGYVAEKELVIIYNLAAVTLLPSFYEGFGLPVVESMACGTPVVCSSRGSLAEIAGPAVICQPEDPGDIAKKTNSILNLSKKSKDTLSTKLLQYTATFTWKKVADETINVYKKCLQK